MQVPLFAHFMIVLSVALLLAYRHGSKGNVSMIGMVPIDAGIAYLATAIFTVLQLRGSPIAWVFSAISLGAAIPFIYSVVSVAADRARRRPTGASRNGDDHAD